MKIFNSGRQMMAFQSRHIKIAFPIRMGNLDDLYVHAKQLCHIWNDCHAESFRYQPGYYNIFFRLVGDLRFDLYLFK